MTAKALTQDPRYPKLQEYMQTGAWKQAQELLKSLLADFPNDTHLRPLMQEAEFKAQVEAEWGGNVGKPRLINNPGMWLRRLATLTLLAAIIYAGSILYRDIIQPRQAAAAAEAALQNTLDEATLALETSQFDAAMAGFRQVLEKDLDNQAAKQGIAQVEEQLALQKQYEEAVALLEQGNTPAAEAALEQLELTSPGYRDVPKRLVALRQSGQADLLYSQANTALQSGEWDDTIRFYEQLRSLDGDYRSAEVVAGLTRAYRAAADDLLAKPDIQKEDIAAALGHLRRMSQFDPSNPETAAEINNLETFTRGADTLAGGNLKRGLEILLPMYQKQPEFLNGALANEIYRAYLAQGDAIMQTGDRLEAFAVYSRAAGISVADNGEAKLRMEAVGVGLTPTATPTLTPTPTITPIPSATVGPTATPPPVDWFKGWIVFRSDRDGRDSIYVMRPDGSGQRPVSGIDKPYLDELYKQQRWSPDGTTFVFAGDAPGGERNVNLFIFRNDLPDGWERQFMYTDWGANEYDPVWSPDNQWIAFASNYGGNDEIWRMGSDGSNKVQLTFNDWEWDKHPTWSPDSQQIAFFSNRTGANQIWIMNIDGSGQTNLSNNDYNDTDPVWLK